MPKGVYKRTKPVWNKGLTKEDPRVAKNIQHSLETNLARYGVRNALRSQPVLDKISDDRHSGKIAQKAAETKLARYGDSHYNNMDKNRQTKLDKYGDEKYNNMEKMFLTKREHHTYNTSKPEEDFYSELKQLYDEDDIVRLYRDSRYPFNCDFYIKSKDLFIELNYHLSHGLHPYDPDNIEDLKLIALWRSKLNQEGPKNQYWIYEKVFTEDDPKKLMYAYKNELNYIAIYRNGLEIKILSRLK